MGGENHVWVEWGVPWIQWVPWLILNAVYETRVVGQGGWGYTRPYHKHELQHDHLDEVIQCSPVA